jgi:hypothetical protein
MGDHRIGLVPGLEDGVPNPGPALKIGCLDLLAFDFA